MWLRVGNPTAIGCKKRFLKSPRCLPVSHSKLLIQYLQLQIMEHNTSNEFFKMEYFEGGYLIKLKNWVLKNVQVHGDCTTFEIAPNPLLGVGQHVSDSAMDEGQSNLA